MDQRGGGEDGPRPLFAMHSRDARWEDEQELMAGIGGAEARVPPTLNNKRTTPTTIFSTAPSAEAGGGGGNRLLEMPRHGGPHQGLYDFLTQWKNNCIRLLEQQDKSLAEWQRMTQFLGHEMNRRIGVNQFGQGGQRFTLQCTVPQKGFDQEVMAQVEKHWHERPDEVFRLPAALQRRIRYQDVRLALRGVTKIQHTAFTPDGNPSFDDIPRRRAAAAEMRRSGRARERAGLNGCASAGKNHGTRVHQQVEACVRWMFESADVSAFSFVRQRLPTGLDFCTLRILTYLDSTGRVPIRSEHVVADPLTLMGTPIDLVCWQCEGFSPERRVGCHFIELKTGYECGPFAEPVPGDKTMQYLTGLYDTPYMRAVVQMVIACIFAAQRYDGYVSEEQSVLHVSPRMGAVNEYGMPGWVEDEKNAAFIYECLLAYVPVAHRIRVCSGMVVPTQFIGQASAPAAEMAAMAAVAAGFVDQQSADDWSFLSDEYLEGRAANYDGTTAAGGDDDGDGDGDGDDRAEEDDEDEDEYITEETHEHPEDEDFLEDDRRQRQRQQSMSSSASATPVNTFRDMQDWRRTTLVT